MLKEKLNVVLLKQSYHLDGQFYNYPELVQYLKSDSIDDKGTSCANRKMSPLEKDNK
jgi:hypothetical protein